MHNIRAQPERFGAGLVPDDMIEMDVTGPGDPGANERGSDALREAAAAADVGRDRSGNQVQRSLPARRMPTNPAVKPDHASATRDTLINAAPNAAPMITIVPGANRSMARPISGMDQTPPADPIR
jgi:hypothetical protein